MQQTDQPNGRPAQPAMFSVHDLLGKNGQAAARYLTPCEPRSVFENEAKLEHTIMNDPQALEVLAGILGTSIRTVANQVLTHEGLQHRADLVPIGGRRARPLAIVELMLHELDSDHIRRGVMYAMGATTPHVIYVAHTFPPRARALVDETRAWMATIGNPITLHLVALHTERCSETGDGYYRLHPVSPTQPTPKRTRAFLEALAQAAAELGDDSLMDLTLTDNRRMESYQGLGERTRIRIYAGVDTTKISILAKSSRLRHRLRRKHLPERLSAAIASLGLQAWERQPAKTTIASYAFPTPQVTPSDSTREDVARIAVAYTTIRSTLLKSVGDASRAGRRHGGRVYYLPTCRYSTSDRNHGKNGRKRFPASHAWPAPTRREGS